MMFHSMESSPDRRVQVTYRLAADGGRDTGWVESAASVLMDTGFHFLYKF
jgi:hypothetical protein